MENVWNPWNLAVLAGGRLPSPVPASRLLQQISLDTVIDVVSHVIRSRHSLAGERIEIASDELSSLEAAEVVSRIVGRRVDVDDELRGGPLPLFAWRDRVGYSVDLDSLRRRFSDVRWRRVEDRAAEPDWSLLAGTPSRRASNRASARRREKRDQAPDRIVGPPGFEPGTNGL